MILVDANLLLYAYDPRARWQRDLAASLSKLAGVHLKRNEAPSAAAALRRVRDIMAALLTRSPDNAQWRSDRDQFDREIARLESQSQSDGLN